jgi:CHASE3 domain sensor protein
LTDSFSNARYVLLRQFDQRTAALRRIVADSQVLNKDCRGLRDAWAALLGAVEEVISLNNAEESVRRAAEKLGLAAPAPPG